MRKWVHRAIIIVIWLIAIVREVAHIFLWEIADLVVINAFLVSPILCSFSICYLCILHPHYYQSTM